MMKFLIWNCRWMRKATSVRARPDVIFLSETHLNKVRVDNLRRRLNFDMMAVAESDGKSGGLVMFWNQELKVTSSELHPNFSDIRIDEHVENG